MSEPRKLKVSPILIQYKDGTRDTLIHRPTVILLKGRNKAVLPNDGRELVKKGKNWVYMAQ